MTREGVIRLARECGLATNEHGIAVALPPIDKLQRFAALVEAANGWRPIETAPKDDSVIDIWRSGLAGDISSGCRCANVRRVDLGGGNVFYESVESGPGCIRDATHWMPLPGCPSAAVAAKDGEA